MSSELPKSADQLDVLLRAYAAEKRLTGSRSKRRRRRSRVGPSEISLVFDTETTTDHAQRCRIAIYQLRVGKRLDEEGIAYDGEALSEREIETLRAYTAARGLPPPLSLAEFRSEIVLARAYDCGALILGFNLPFDLARIALDAAPARTGPHSRRMHGGFTLKLSEKRSRPHVQIKHLNARSALYNFTAPAEAETVRSKRKAASEPIHRGHFVDVRTLAAALTSSSHTLESLCRALKVETQKHASAEHGAELSFDYLDYARADVQATWECWEALRDRLESYGLDLAPWDVTSEATIGKAALATMQIAPWRTVQPDCPPELLAKIMPSYFGGRTEVRWRRTIKRVALMDFTSMYPTVCTLMGLWRFVIAEGFSTSDATAEARELLATATADGLQDRGVWRDLTMLVRVEPDFDLLPVRARYQRERHPTIGLNFLTAPFPVWVTLADCLAAKLLSGKAPKVLEAIRFDPGPPQAGLRPIDLFGVHRIDPYKDDLFHKLVCLREAERRSMAGKSEAEKAEIEGRRAGLKTTVNATSYGIFIQVNVEKDDNGADLLVHGPSGDPFANRSNKIETPGPYSHPLLATLITGAARLMLALAEHRALALGLDWVFCDTDSIAVAKPDELPEAAFAEKVRELAQWFSPLNPYDFDGSILKIEEYNFDPDGSGELRPLYCLAISSKRYALFNVGADGRPILRKVSAHGLGHLLAPYGDEDAPPDIPTPLPSLREGKDRAERWHHDLWWKLIEAAMAGRLDTFRCDYHPAALLQPAVSRYSPTTPELLRWHGAMNDGKAYADQVKPFGFAFNLHPKRRLASFDDFAALAGDCGDGDDIHPVAPFDRDLRRAIAQAFDRVTGKPVSPDQLQTYAEALAEYHHSPESKFLNGEPFDTGRTERRHIIAGGVELIGKEADALEETFFLGIKRDLTISYGAHPLAAAKTFGEIIQLARHFGEKPIADATGLPRSTVRKVASGQSVRTKVAPAELHRRLQLFLHRKAREQAEQHRKIRELQEAVIREGGVRKAARKLGLDPSNLSKVVRRHTPPDS